MRAMSRRVAIGGGAAAAVAALAVAVAGLGALAHGRAKAEVPAITATPEVAGDIAALLGSADFKDQALGLRRVDELAPDQRAAVVTSLAGHPRPEVRLLAVAALRKLEDRSPFRPLLAHLASDDPDPDVRSAAGQLIQEAR